MSDHASTFIGSIYSKINELFGGGGQHFLMEFPTRQLNIDEFLYDTSPEGKGKPSRVMENEARLTDDLLLPTFITGGSTGKSISKSYKQVINNYVPNLSDLKDFVIDRSALKVWLLDEVEIPSHLVDPKTGIKHAPRIDVTTLLAKEYYEAKKAWEKEKRKQREELSRDRYVDFVATEGNAKQQVLDRLYENLVVRGSYHEVQTVLSFLNVASPAQQLNEAKAGLRNSELNSVDGSGHYYPVHMQPSNWALGLKPNNTPQDLLQTKDVIQDNLRQKRKHLSRLKQRRNRYELLNGSPEELKKAQETVKKARAQMNKAEQELVATYGEGVMACFDLYTAMQSGGTMGGKKKVADKGKNAVDVDVDAAIDSGLASELVPEKELADSKKNNEKLNELKKKEQDGSKLSADEKKEKAELEKSVSPENDPVRKAISELCSGVSDQMAKQDQVLNTIDDYSNALVDSAVAMNSDYTALIAQVDNDIAATTDEIKDLEELLTTAHKERQNPLATPELDKVSAQDLLGVEATNSDLDFMEVVIRESTKSLDTSSSEASSSSTSKHKVGALIFSTSKTVTSQSSSSTSSMFSSDLEISVAFRAAKVNINRGWLDAGVLGVCGSMLRINEELKFNNKVSKENIDRQLDGEGDITSVFNSEANKHLLPSYPVSFIIAKDIVFKISSSKEDESVSKAFESTDTSSHTGFFGFSKPKGSSSRSQSENAYSSTQGKDTVVKIKGPQILGWMLEVSPIDNSNVYTSMTNSEEHKSILLEIEEGIRSISRDPKKIITISDKEEEILRKKSEELAAVAENS